MEVRAVCADPSLDEQQKMEKIQEIHRSAQEQMTALMTPEQREKLRECQRAAGGHKLGGHPGGLHMPGAGGGHPQSSGPCAEALR